MAAGRPKDKHEPLHRLTGKDVDEAVKIAKDMLTFAHRAVPDAFTYDNDARVLRAKAFLKRMTGVTYS